jgi:hypothetical protein
LQSAESFSGVTTGWKMRSVGIGQAVLRLANMLLVAFKRSAATSEITPLSGYKRT